MFVFTASTVVPGMQSVFNVSIYIVYIKEKHENINVSGGALEF